MTIHRLLLLSGLLALPAACAKKASAPPVAPSHTEATVAETDLLKIRLLPAAQARLGLQTDKVALGEIQAIRNSWGEIVSPNARGGVPTNSASSLEQLGNQQTVADGEVARTQAQLKLAHIALARTDRLLREEAGSQRARDEAAAALGAAEAQASAAQRQRDLLGPAIDRLNGQNLVWVRVPVFATDIDRIRRNAPAQVRALNEGGRSRTARAVNAPPSANAAAGTVDLYFAVDNRDRAFRIGQRAAVDLPLASRVSGRVSIPESAIVRDIYGGEWVYRKAADGSFLRQRIEITGSEHGRALLQRGLEEGAEIVTVGAMELFGTEFGVAH